MSIILHNWLNRRPTNNLHQNKKSGDEADLGRAEGKGIINGVVTLLLYFKLEARLNQQIHPVNENVDVCPMEN